jgi:hypothetical protein
VAQSVAAVPSPLPGRHLVYINMHLHRTEAALLSQNHRLRQEEIVTMDEQGWAHLSRLWVEAVAAEFVNTTRFDPLHMAATEQAIYDRLPSVLADLGHRSTVPFDLRSDLTVHGVTLKRALFAQKAASYFAGLQNLIRTLLNDKEADRESITLLLSHRFSGLPGIGAFLAGLDHPRTVELDQGAGALNVLLNIDDFTGKAYGKDSDYFTSRPWQRHESPASTRTGETAGKTQPDPTHLLYRDLAYPITESPTFICMKEPKEAGTLDIKDGFEDEDHRYCALQKDGSHAVLTVFRPGDIWLDDEPAAADTVLCLGQTIRVGPSGDTIRLIACLDHHET